MKKIENRKTYQLAPVFPTQKSKQQAISFDALFANIEGFSLTFNSQRGGRFRRASYIERSASVSRGVLGESFLDRQGAEALHVSC